MNEAGLLEARCHAVAEENQQLKDSTDAVMADADQLREQAVQLQQDNVRLRERLNDHGIEDDHID